MANWIHVGDEQELKEAGKTCVRIEDLPVLVCYDQQQWHAFVNSCPHAGLPLDSGEMAGKVLTCPYHGYAYDVVSGRNVDCANDVPLRIFNLRTRDGQIEIDLDTTSTE